MSTVATTIRVSVAASCSASRRDQAMAAPVRVRDWVVVWRETDEAVMVLVGVRTGVDDVRACVDPGEGAGTSSTRVAAPCRRGATGLPMG